jgi:hypothetical protein
MESPGCFHLTPISRTSSFRHSQTHPFLRSQARPILPSQARPTLPSQARPVVMRCCVDQTQGVTCRVSKLSTTQLPLRKKR